MTNGTPVACSLEASELQQRLAAIAEIGTNDLISRDIEGGRHLLYFRSSARLRRQLENIIAAEAQCCAFLDLSLRKERDLMILSITAPEGAQALADGFAEAFLGATA